METKFTKGEWIDLGYRVDVDVVDGLSGICEMSDWMNKKEMEANAKLIAAAPDIFNALIDLINLKYYKDQFGKDEYYSINNPIVWESAKKAIKKALTND